MTLEKDDPIFSTAIADSGGNGSKMSSSVVQLKNYVIDPLISFFSPLVAKRKCFRKVVHDKAK